MSNKIKSNEYLKALVFFIVGLVICSAIIIYQVDFTFIGIVLFAVYIMGLVSVFYGIYIAYKKWAKV